MRKRIFTRKPFVVDGQPYSASLTARISDAFVDLRLSLQADFDNRSYCTIRGLRNFGYFFNYGYWDNDGFSGAQQMISITPRLVAVLIRFARQEGWSPESSASNHEIALTNLEAKALLDGDNSPDQKQA